MKKTYIFLFLCLFITSFDSLLFSQEATNSTQKLSAAQKAQERAKRIAEERKKFDDSIILSRRVVKSDVFLPSPVLSLRTLTFQINGNNFGNNKTLVSSVKIIASDNISKVISGEIKKWTNNRITATLLGSVADTLKPGYYSVVVVVKSGVVLRAKNKLIVPGIMKYEVSDQAMKGTLLSNSNSISSFLTIKGVGFRDSKDGNYVVLNRRSTIKKFQIWNDSVIKMQLPISMKRGYSYDVKLRHVSGLEFTTYKDSSRKFRYPGISQVVVGVDTAGIINGEVFGIGFDKKASNALFFNDIKVKEIVEWTPTRIKFKISFIRGGRYAPTISQYTIKRGKKPIRIRLFANDSVDFVSFVKYREKNIWGSYYAMSLREVKILKNSNENAYIYTLPQDTKISLSLFTQNGLRKVVGIVPESSPIHSKGRYQISFANDDIPYGKYILLLQVDKNIKIPIPYIR